MRLRERLLMAATSTGRYNTLTKTQKMACMLVNQRRHRGFTVAAAAVNIDKSTN